LEFICEREKLLFDTLIYLEPVERIKNRSNVMKFRRFGDNTSSRVQFTIKITTIDLVLRLGRTATHYNVRHTKRQ